MMEINYLHKGKDEILAELDAIKFYIKHTNIKQHNYNKYQIYKYLIIQLKEKLTRINEANKIMVRIVKENRR